MKKNNTWNIRRDEMDEMIVPSTHQPSIEDCQIFGVISTQKVCSANAAAPESLLRQEIGPDKLFTQKSPLGRHSIFFHLNNSSHYIIYGKVKMI